MADTNNVEETLVSRRSKRSTAGNRMQAAMAEMAIEDPEADDDQDFSVEIYEEDVFESDFESTDEEEAQREETEAGEKDAQVEEKQARKAARSRLERATAAAHARQKMTFNPTATQPKPPPKPKRQTEASAEEIRRTKAARSGNRQSKRSHTIMNTSATFERLKKSEQQKALQAPKKSKSETRALTQAELIARALDNEEGNTVEHRDYLQNEEEKRKRARVSRETVKGPLLRWISKGEEVKMSIVEPGTTYQNGHTHSTSSRGTLAPSLSSDYQSATPQDIAALPSSSTTITAIANLKDDSSMSSANVNHPSSLTHQSATNEPSTSYNPPPIPETATIFTSLLQAHQQPTPQLQVVEKLELRSRNYLVHELDQQENTPKPQWSETMEAVFGDHVRWEDVKVYSGKSRPFSRIRQTCPITGLQARYLDPRTGVPFANVEAYRTLTSLLNHEYMWSPALGCYTRKAPGAISNEAQDTS
ncbi:hypothetical protein VNI00_007529 [Paramarasmius palmivorus]|uniref:Vps72/YL1 C-terminal domain-containing protein n=1 Tax=Paramarasmius palmivorus TaxID=297713 RepID=A0AAW0D0J2_9AGAR